MIETIAATLQTKDDFAIVSHVNPDGDAVGCLLGIGLALYEMGKTVWLLTGEDLPDMYDFLPGQDLIVQSAGEIDPEPAWIIALDTANAQRIAGDISQFRNRARLINIDHHPTNPGYGDLNLVDPSATSTAELAFRVLEAMGHRLSPSVAKCLYTGIITDTGCFRFPGVNAATFRTASKLLASGFDSYDVTRPLYEERTVARVHLERLMLERVEILLDGRLVMSTFFAEDFARLRVDRSETEDLVNRLREVRGVEVGALITELGDSYVRASLRSKTDVDVSEVAGTLGGGGHRRAAGLRVEMSVDQVKQRLTSAIEQALEQRPGSERVV
jgi:phosphoesterase RecJ-like protein